MKKKKQNPKCRNCGKRGKPVKLQGFLNGSAFGKVSSGCFKCIKFSVGGQ